jgi:hypothetical protein
MIEVVGRVRFGRWREPFMWNGPLCGKGQEEPKL